jgi:hypothetical protein
MRIAPISRCTEHATASDGHNADQIAPLYEAQGSNATRDLSSLRSPSAVHSLLVAPGARAARGDTHHTFALV